MTSLLLIAGWKSAFSFVKETLDLSCLILAQLPLIFRPQIRKKLFDGGGGRCVLGACGSFFCYRLCKVVGSETPAAVELRKACSEVGDIFRLVLRLVGRAEKIVSNEYEDRRERRTR